MSGWPGLDGILIPSLRKYPGRWRESKNAAQINGQHRNSSLPKIYWFLNSTLLSDTAR